MTPNQRKKMTESQERMRDRIRAKGYALATEDAYCRWLGKYIQWLYTTKPSPAATHEQKVEGFLTEIARSKRAATTPLDLSA